MAGPEVTQFVVIPPTDQLENAQAAYEQIVGALVERFPGFTFGVADACPFGDQEGFDVIPVMGTVGDQEASVLCEDPPPGIVDEMKAVCESLDLSAVQYLN